MISLKDITNRARQHPSYNNHERVFEFQDEESGLHGFVAIHNSNLGSAVGGTRMFPYATQDDALNDVLRLSRGMTYKCAMAGVAHGGGKAVIIGDPAQHKTPSLIAAYASAIDQLKGAFYTGEDVGISEDDVQEMLVVSPYFIGKRGVAGDPSPYASLSTFRALQAAHNEVYGGSDLGGRVIGVKGTGKVGGGLVRLLKDAGAHVKIADIHEAATIAAQQSWPDIEIISPQEIHAQKLDVYAPCAMGNEFTASSARELQTKLICGGANNQLASDEVGDWLFTQGIWYVPDYIANAGGVINVVDELESDGYRRERVLERIDAIGARVANIFQRAREQKMSPHRVADHLAEEIFFGVIAPQAL